MPTIKNVQTSRPWGAKFIGKNSRLSGQYDAPTGRKTHFLTTEETQYLHATLRSGLPVSDTTTAGSAAMAGARPDNDDRQETGPDSLATNTLPRNHAEPSICSLSTLNCAKMCKLRPLRADIIPSGISYAGSLCIVIAEARTQARFVCCEVRPSESNLAPNKAGFVWRILTTL